MPNENKTPRKRKFQGLGTLLNKNLPKLTPIQPSTAMIAARKTRKNDSKGVVFVFIGGKVRDYDFFRKIVRYKTTLCVLPPTETTSIRPSPLKSAARTS